MSFTKIPAGVTTLVAPTDASIVNNVSILSCDSTLGVITINLPSIASLNTAGALGMKYIVNDRAGVAQTNNITIVCDAADKINDAANIVINTQNGSATFQISDLNDWQATLSNGGLPQVAVTATVAGLTTGIIANGNVMVNVTSADAAYLVTLPKPVPGMVIRAYVGANGYNVQSHDPATVGINGGIGAGKKSAIATLVYTEFKATTALNWVANSISAAGVRTVVPVAA